MIGIIPGMEVKVKLNLNHGLTWSSIAATEAAGLRVEFIALGPTACYEVLCIRDIWTGESGNLAGVSMRALLAAIK